MKITFKKQPQETGLSGVARPHPDTDIKVDGSEVGVISAPTAFTKGNEWRVRLAVKREPTPADPCPWRWVTLKARFASEPEARSALKDGLLEHVLRYSNLVLHRFQPS